MNFSQLDFLKILEKMHLMEAYRHHERMRLLNDSYQRLRLKQSSWNEELKEREELEKTLEDGFKETDF